MCLQPRCQKRPCYAELSCLEDTRVPCVAYSEMKEECLERALCDTVGMWPGLGRHKSILGFTTVQEVMDCPAFSSLEHKWNIFRSPATKCVSKLRVCFCDTWSLLLYGLNGSYLVLCSLCGHHSTGGTAVIEQCGDGGSGETQLVMEPGRSSVRDGGREEAQLVMEAGKTLS